MLSNAKPECEVCKIEVETISHLFFFKMCKGCTCLVSMLVVGVWSVIHNNIVIHLKHFQGLLTNIGVKKRVLGCDGFCYFVVVVAGKE